MDVKLNIFDGSAHCFSKTVHLPCIIGRSRLSHISIVHPLVSRQHCEIYEDHGLIMLRDLGSLNGTFYKNIRIGRGVALPYGEVFSIGALHFVLEQVSSETEETSSGEKIFDQSASTQAEKKDSQPADSESSSIITKQPLYMSGAKTSDSSVTQMPALFKSVKPAAPVESAVPVEEPKAEIPEIFFEETDSEPAAAAPAPEKISVKDPLPKKAETPEPEEKEEKKEDNASTDFDMLWDEMFGK